MNRLVSRFCLILALAAPALAVSAAEQKNLAAVIAWSGAGRVFQIAPGTMEFLGALEGIMYIETSEGEIDEAFVECSVKQYLHSDAANTSATGNCMIVQGPEDTIFAEFHCDGQVGSWTGVAGAPVTGVPGRCCPGGRPARRNLRSFS